MISIHNIKTIFKKEFLQLMRDKSILFTNFFLPLFGLPLYLIFGIEMANFLSKQEISSIKDSTQYTLSFQGEMPSPLAELFSQDKKIKIHAGQNHFAQEEINHYREKFRRYIELKTLSKKGLRSKLILDRDKLKQAATELEIARKEFRTSQEKIGNILALKEGEVHLAMFKNSDGVLVCYLFYSKEKRLSRNAHFYIQEILQRFEKELVEKNKNLKNISDADLEPVSLWDVDMEMADSPVLKSIGVGLGGGIIFLLLIALFNPAINTTLGERDQQTYKLLLMNPISPLEIFIGKYMNVALQGLLTLIPYAIEFFVFYAWGSTLFVFSYIPEITAAKLIFLVFGVISVSLLISALCFLVSSFARSRTQAQSLMTLLMFAMMIPVGSMGALDIKLSFVTALFPLINFPMITENLMLANPNYGMMIVALITNLISSLIVIWFSLGAFLIQWKGHSDRRGLNDLLSFKRRKVIELVPAHALIAFTLAFLGYVYGGLIMQTLKIELFIYLFSPILFSLGTTVFILFYSGLDFTKVFKWDNPGLKNIILVIMVAFVLGFLTATLGRSADWMSMLKPVFPPLFEGPAIIMGIGSLLLFAIIPGVMEEILFRGVIYQSLRNQYPVMISAVLTWISYAIIQIMAFHNTPALVAGAFLPYLYEKRGLVTCIIFHVAWNSMLVLMEFI